MSASWLYALPFLVAAWWLFVTTLLRRGGRLTRRLQVETGSPMRESSWGSAFINGISAQGCVKLAEYHDGYVIRMMWVFGNGKLWLPKPGLRIGVIGPGVPRRRRVISGEHELLLFEELADFVGEANDLNLAPFTGPKLPRAVEWLNRVFNKTR